MINLFTVALLFDFYAEYREGNGNLLQYSCLGNLKDRGAWQAIVHGAAKELDTTW